MRNIEFRAKDLLKDTWYYGYYMEHKRSMRCFIVDLDEEVMATEHLVDKNTLGQFTGLCDKNGKNIYEGDIIKSHYGSIYIVKYFADWSGFSLKLVFLNNEGKLSRATGRQHLYKNDCTRLEILGNIWDNLELLGGSDEECDN